MDNRKQEETSRYKQKFVELNLDGFEYVEFVRKNRHHIKCLKCGELLNRSDDIFKGKTKRIKCRNCLNGTVLYSKEVDEILEYYSQKHTVKETCEKFGITHIRLNNLARIRGVTNNRTLNEINREKGKIGALKTFEERKQKLIKKCKARGFEYVGGFTGHRDAKILIRCCFCGETFERGYQSIRKSKAECSKCKHEKAQAKLKAKQEEKKRLREKKELERLASNPLRLSYYQLERQKELDKLQTCRVCGGSYTIRQWQQIAGAKYIRVSGYCCLECQRKAKRQYEHERKKKLGIKENHRARARKFGCEYDPTVTLKKLIERDGLFCSICGLICNPDDHDWTEYMGPTSPTIDHIIPMAQGGGHIWSNVQIAHAQCNSWKSDKKEVNGKYETNDKSRRTLCRR